MTEGVEAGPPSAASPSNPPSHEEAVEAARRIVAKHDFRRERFLAQYPNAREARPLDELIVARALLSREMLRSDDVPRKGSGETEARPSGVEDGWAVEGAWSPTFAPEYWLGSSVWSSDHLLALRFAREIDAQRAADAMCAGMNVRICYHEWDIRECVLMENIRDRVSSVRPEMITLATHIASNAKDYGQDAAAVARAFLKQAGQAEAHPAAAPAAQHPSSPSRDSVLEEAAKAAHRTANGVARGDFGLIGPGGIGMEIVRAIRALKDVRPETPPT